MSILVWIDALQIGTSVASLGLNGLLLVCNHRRGKERWSTDGILIAINATLDAVVNAYSLAATLVRLANPAVVYGAGAWCKASYVVERTLNTSCLNLVMLLAVVRYLVIVRKHQSNPRFWTCLAVGVVAALFAMTLVRSDGAQLAVYPSGMYCYTLSVRSGWMTRLLQTLYLLLCLPHLVIIPLCYLGIARHYGRLMVDLQDARAGRVRGIVVVAAAYWVTILPHMLLFLAFRFGTRPPSPPLDAVAYWLKTGSFVINALFPLLFHRQINDRCRDLFRRPGGYVPHQ